MRVVGLRGSFWPTRTQERILQTIFLDEARARAAWRDVRDELDLDVMEDGSYFLLPSLYRRLVELSIDDPDLPRLKGVYRRTWYRNTLLIDSMRAPLVELRASDVTLLILGAAAAGRSYSEHGLRWLEYVEAIVPTAELDRCRQVLERSGFALLHGAQPQHRLRPTPFVDEAGNILVVGGAPPLDLLAPGRLSASAHELWGRTVQGELAGEAVRVLHPTDELMLVCLGGATPAGASKPIWVADAMAVIAADGSIDWERLCAQAEETRLALRLADALAYLRDSLDAPVPERLPELLRARANSRRDSLSHRLTSRTPGVLGGLPATLGEYVRVSSDRPVVMAVFGYPRFLQQMWGLEHLRQLPVAAAAKTLGALRSVLLPGGRAADHRQLSALSRGS